jgi:hypothetical protein
LARHCHLYWRALLIWCLGAVASCTSFRSSPSTSSTADHRFLEVPVSIRVSVTPSVSEPAPCLPLESSLSLSSGADNLAQLKPRTFPLLTRPLKALATLPRVLFLDPLFWVTSVNRPTSLCFRLTSSPYLRTPVLCSGPVSCSGPLSFSSGPRPPLLQSDPCF